jgi:hypothetical protein
MWDVLAFGERLRFLRERRNWSQREASLAMNWTAALARLGSGSKDGQMRGRSGDLRGVQSTGRVVDLWGYRSSRPRIEDRNRPADIGHDGPIEPGVIDVRYKRSNYVVTWEFPGVSDVQEMHEITQKMFSIKLAMAQRHAR